MVTRRKVLKTGIGVLACSALSGCSITGGVRSPWDETQYEQTKEYRSYLDAPPLDDGPTIEAGPPFYATVITTDTDAREQFNWDSLPEPTRYKWERVDYDSQFATAFVSRRKLVRPGNFEGHVVDTSFSSDGCNFEIDLKTWPPVAEFDGGRHLYVELGIFERGAESPPTYATIEIPGQLPYP